jgi:drug/metabolite transporter (DMT)-like permease
LTRKTIWQNQITLGKILALISAGLLGTTPILGKLAIDAGMAGVSVVAIRTIAAAILLLITLLIFNRRALYIFPVGLLGCLLAGGINGLGSLFFYLGLERVDAGLAQLLFMIYPVFVALLLYLDGQRHTPLTLVRLAIGVPAIYLLTQASAEGVDPLGVLLMLAAAFLYALHIPINARVLFEVPAPTVTLYTLLAMAIVTFAGQLFLVGSPEPGLIPQAALWPLIGLTLVTAFSRLSLFSGVKYIGGMQTSLLGLAEMLMTLLLAYLVLGESLSPGQWLGAFLIAFSISLVGIREDSPGKLQQGRGFLYWLRPPLSPGAREAESESEKLLD